MTACRTAVIAWLLAVPSAELALAQTPDLEPGVQTSPSSPPPVSPPPAAPPPTQAMPPKSAPAAAAALQAAPKAATKDHIELDTTQISGNRELPKVMYVVPWRKADPGEFAGRPPNSLLDEALTPVDRDVFRRQNRYYAALEARPGAAGGTASQTDKPESKDEK